MDESVGRVLVTKHCSKMMTALGLNRWRLDIIWESRKPGHKADIRTQFEYQRASLAIDANQIEDEEDFLDVLRHELLHILHSGFIHLRSHAIDLASTQAEVEMIDTAWMLGAETCIRAMEWFLDQELELTPLVMIQQSEAVLDKRRELGSREAV